MSKPILNFRDWNRLNESLNRTGFERIYEAGSYLPKEVDQGLDPDDLAVEYRIWANLTPELDKKWGGTSIYDCDKVNKLNPNNDSFKKSWDAGGGKLFMETDTYKAMVNQIVKKSESQYILSSNKFPIETSITEAVAKAKKKGGLIFAYFYRVDSENHKKFFENVLMDKGGIFNAWTSENKLTVYCAQMASEGYDQKEIPKLNEYKELAKLFGITALPVVKLIKSKDEGGGRTTYEVLDTKYYKGESATEWCNSIKAGELSEYQPKSANYSDAEYTKIESQMKKYLNDKWKKTVTDKDGKKSDVEIEGLRELVQQHYKLSANTFNPKIRTSIEGLDQTLKGLVPNLKLACDLKYHQFWKQKKAYLSKLLETTTIKQGEKEIILNIIELLNKMSDFCNDIESQVQTDNKVDQNLGGVTITGEKSEEQKKKDQLNRGHENRFDDEIVRAGADSIDTKTETAKDRRKRAGNWFMKNVVNRN